MLWVVRVRVGLDGEGRVVVKELVHKMVRAWLCAFLRACVRVCVCVCVCFHIMPYVNCFGRTVLYVYRILYLG